MSRLQTPGATGVPPPADGGVVSRLLAVDPGSVALGVAYFEDASDVRPASTDLFVRDGLPWLERMQYIAAQLLLASRTRGWMPDVVAIEDVVLGINVKSTKTMSMTRGYLYRVIGELFPRARYIDINPSSTKAAAYSRAVHRAQAKSDIRHAVETMTGLRDLDENICDAIAVGWAAFGILNRESWERLVEQSG